LKTIVPKTNVVVDESFISVGDVDWVAQGAVTGVKNQGNCGSCWAFSTTGGLEGLFWLQHKDQRSFAEQQLVDCSTLNLGCNGGSMDRAYTYVKNHGMSLEVEYPYTAVKGRCNRDFGDYKIGGHADPSGCTNLANALVARPISVAVDANKWSTYKSGVFNDCGSSLDHGVLLVGVTDNYWKVKNSWATTWGEEGYIRLARGNTCGICNQPSYPTA